MGVEGIPTPVPTAAIVRRVHPAFVHRSFVVLMLRCSMPDFGLFSRYRGLRAARGLMAVLALNSLTRKRVHRRTGFDLKDTDVLYGLDEFSERVLGRVYDLRCGEVTKDL